MPFEPCFGDVWLVELADGPEPRLVVSGDMYHSARPQSFLAVQVETPQHPSYVRGLVTEPVKLETGDGVAHLNLITTISRSRLVRRIGRVPSDRNIDIGRRVQNLIGL